MEAYILAHPECDITLYAICLIRVSLTFWETPEIKKEIQDYFSNIDEDSWSPNEWHKITKKVLNLVDKSEGLVLTMIPELKDAILNIGVKMYDWIWYLNSEFGLNVCYAKQIFWTPLGFVDEVKIFKFIWENDESLFNDDKQIFKIACVFTQEEFIEKHQKEIVKEWKKLHIKIQNPNNVYDIISTYLCHYISEILCKKRKRNYYRPGNVSLEQFEMGNQNLINRFDNQRILQNNLSRSIDSGIALPSHMMVRLCIFAGLTHGTKYYYKKLNDTLKKKVNLWFQLYASFKLLITNPSHYVAGKLREIAAFTVHTDFNWENRTPYQLLYLCPLESVVWPNFRKWLRGVKCDPYKFLKGLERIIRNDSEIGLPIIRNLFERLLKVVSAKVSNIKKIKES